MDLAGNSVKRRNRTGEPRLSTERRLHVALEASEASVWKAHGPNLDDLSYGMAKRRREPVDCHELPRRRESKGW